MKKKIGLGVMVLVLMLISLLVPLVGAASGPPTVPQTGEAIPSSGEAISPYKVAMVQHNYEMYVPDAWGKFDPNISKRNLRRMCDAIDSCFVGIFRASGVRLIAFSEFSWGGFYAATTTMEEMITQIAVSIPGTETDILADKAKQWNVYIAANAYENDPQYPDWVFNTSFIINPEGKIILKYRKVHMMFGCSPHDILDVYTNPITGEPDAFPVVDTEIGRLGMMTCMDIAIPETTRVYAMKGAEVLIRLTNMYAHEAARWTLRARANDNSIYIVNVNFAGAIIGDFIDTSSGGGAGIYDYRGNVIAEAQDATSQLVMGRIDVMALRTRREAGRDAVSSLRAELYAPYYTQTIFPPNKVLLEGPLAYARDPKASEWKAEAGENRQALYDFYSEDDVP